MAPNARTTEKLKSQKRGKKKHQQVNPVYYVVCIDSWDWNFSFGVNNCRYFSDPYSDYRCLQIKGKLLFPNSVKCEKVEITLLPNEDLNNLNRQNASPTAVGSINLHRGTLTMLLSMPQDALEPVLNMLVADRFNYLVMTGDQLRYRQGKIRSFRIQQKLDEDDLPDTEK